MECQQNIMQMEQTAENENESDAEQEMLSKMVNLDEIQLPEAKYLLEKLLSMSINQSCLAVQKDGAVREMENRMNQASKQNTLHQQLLQHMIEQQVCSILFSLKTKKKYSLEVFRILLRSYKFTIYFRIVR
jgi:hypothetical protein